MYSRKTAQPDANPWNTSLTAGNQQERPHPALAGVNGLMTRGVFSLPHAQKPAGSAESLMSIFGYLGEHADRKPHGEVGGGFGAPGTQQPQQTEKQPVPQSGGGSAVGDPAFEQWWRSIAGYEGSLADWEKQAANKHDRGGKTNWGVTHSTYMSVGPQVGLEATEEAFRAMTPLQASRIGFYFWKKAGCHLIHDVGVCIVVADWYWGSGSAGTKRVQRVLRPYGYEGAIDGVIGPVSAAAINAAPPSELIQAITAGRIQHFDDIIARDDTQKQFEKGWKRRARERGEEGLRFAGVDRAEMLSGRQDERASPASSTPRRGTAPAPAQDDAPGHAAAHAPARDGDAATPAAVTHASPIPEEESPFLADAHDAVHDGDETHALGAGDEVFDASGKVIAAFPATPDGVVSAALYELHRGERRSLRDIRQDDTAGRVKRGAQAAREKRVPNATGTKTVGANTDDADGQVIGHLRGGRAARPIDAYLHSAKTESKNPWCGAFATFAYQRAGIVTESLAYSLNVEHALARAGNKEQHGAYYRINASKENHRFSGELQEGSYDQKKARYLTHETVESGLDIDIRAGDVLWLQHDKESGHVGIIIGVHKTAKDVRIVTVEGNVGDKLDTRTHTLTVGANNRCSATFKGWGRPPELQSEPAGSRAPGGETDADADGCPDWIEEAQRHVHVKDQKSERNDR